MYDVDVVILSLNRTEQTIETIHNVLAQKDITLKLWVVDQGSSEENRNKLRQALHDIPLVTLKELDKNYGVPGGRNVGAQLGKGEIIVNIDNDAELASPHALTQAIQLFKHDPTLGAAGFRVKNYYTEKDDELAWAYPKALKQQRDESFLTTRFAGGASAIRRAAFEQAGGFDDQLFFYWEELDLSYQLINLGYHIIYYPQIVVRHKVSPEGRVNWGNQRYYYYTRNAIWINYKYYQNFVGALLLAMGYTVKGVQNHNLQQAIRGCLHGINLCLVKQRRYQLAQYKLGEAARNYINQHELSYRGSIVDRIRTEALAKLPT